jgi:hypothetical protein
MSASHDAAVIDESLNLIDDCGHRGLWATQPAAKRLAA